MASSSPSDRRHCPRVLAARPEIEQAGRRALKPDSIVGMTEVKEPPCLVLGGGILGCAAAFYLRERGLQGQIIVIDAEELAAGASGAAAGLLMAEDASSSPAFRSFTKHSVALHQGLASDSRFVDCGYRKITLAAFQTAQGRRDAAGTKKALPGWASLRAAERAKLTVQSAPVATFQCRPKLLAHALFTVRTGAVCACSPSCRCL